MIAAIRPDEWNVPLLVHVLGAMVLVGGLFAGAAALAVARGDARVLRVGYWSLLAIALPGYVVMRVGAEWIADKQGLNEADEDPAWIVIGYITADLGALLLLVSMILGGIGVVRLRRGGGSGLLKATMVISLLLLAVYVVAVWAMGAKPD